jgi:hypothetical protein
MVCQLIILTLQGLLLCGATGGLVDNKSFTAGYQQIFDSGRSAQYCVPTDDVERAMDLPFELVTQKLRVDSIPLSRLGECPR